MNSVIPRSYRLFSPLAGLLLAGFLLSFGAACSGELDPGDPKDAYDLFRHAFFAGDGEAVWERLDDQTRDYFDDRYDRLEGMNNLIERYLPHTDHQIARSQSGAELVSQLDSGRDLLIRILEPVDFPDDEAVRFGSEVEQLQMAEDRQSAIAVTRGGQQFGLVLQDDDLWYVNLVDSDELLEHALNWLHQNEDALGQTVEDLIEEERRLRERIISELMDLELDD